MNWIDIASIVFVCVTMNHLGLVKAIEGVFKIKLHVINCPRCFTFWFTLTYCLLCCHQVAVTQTLAISFLSSYAAIWLELLEGFIDTLYTKVYEKICPTPDDTASADTDGGGSAGPVP